MNTTTCDAFVDTALFLFDAAFALLEHGLLDDDHDISTANSVLHFHALYLVALL